MMFRRLLTGAAGALGLFHVWLFVRQASAGELSSPETIAKWLAAAVLAVAIAALRRKGVSLVRGRKAVAVWTLAALLHAPAAGERLATFDTPVIPEAVATLAQVAAAIAPLAGALLLLWLASARTTHTSRRGLAALPSLARPRQHLLFALDFAPRPPPSV